MELRQAQAGDATGLAVVARRAILISALTWYSQAHLEQWASAFSDASMRHTLQNSTTFVADEPDRIAGFSNLVVSPQGRSVLDLLFVDPDFAGRGVARALIAAIEKEARSSNIAEVWVDASIPAAPVFQHLGYQVRERYSKELGGLSFDNTWLSRRLVENAS